MTLTFESFETARTRILGFGGAIEVLEPLALLWISLSTAQVAGRGIAFKLLRRDRPRGA